MTTITLLDGGMGQELVRRSGVAPTPMWSALVMLENPPLVQTLHEEFIQAGAEVITVNAYSATPERLERDGLEDKFAALQKSACHVALQARENANRSGVQVAGCLPPLVASYRPDVAPDEEQSMINYRRVVEVQAPFVDLFMCETMGSVSEARYASTAALESGKPVWVGLTLDDDNPACLRSGESWQEAVAALSTSGIEGLLLNCSRPETIDAVWEEFAQSSSLRMGAYANGFTAIEALQPGGTVDNLDAREDLGPESYGKFISRWIDQGATIVGGCCEVLPAHIAHLHTAVLGRS